MLLRAFLSTRKILYFTSVSVGHPSMLKGSCTQTVTHEAQDLQEMHTYISFLLCKMSISPFTLVFALK